MTTRRKYPEPDVKTLYGRAALRCSLQDCRTDLSLNPTSTDPRGQRGDIGHIRAHSPEGPRFDPNYPSKHVDTYENWILLCKPCHTKVDIKPIHYSTPWLIEQKQKHERWIQERIATAMPTVTMTELDMVIQSILAAEKLPSEDFMVTPPQQKMDKNGLTIQTRQLILTGISRTEEVDHYIQHMAKISPDFPEKLTAGFVVNYQKFWNAGLRGDALFESMHLFAAQESSDFLYRAAGLAVLTHLFEKCEVFEK